MNLFIKMCFFGLLILVIGGFAYFAMTDVPVSQQAVTKTIPLNDLSNTVNE